MRYRPVVEWDTLPKQDCFTNARGRREMVLLEDWSFRVDGVAHTIPQGFTYDDASSPRAAWAFISPADCGEVGPLGHDFLYRREGLTAEGKVYSRYQADRIFLIAMKKEGIGWKATAAYHAVRLFGARAFRKAP